MSNLKQQIVTLAAAAFLLGSGAADQVETAPYAASFEQMEGIEYVHIEGTRSLLTTPFGLLYPEGPQYFEEETWITPELVNKASEVLYNLAELAGLDHGEFSASVADSFRETTWYNDPHFALHGQRIISGMYNIHNNRIRLFGINTQMFIHEGFHRMLANYVDVDQLNQLQRCYNEGSTELLVRTGWRLDEELINNYPGHTLLTAALGREFYLMPITNPTRFAKVINELELGSEDPEIRQYVDQFASRFGLEEETLYDIFMDPNCANHDHPVLDSVNGLREIIESHNISWPEFLERLSSGIHPSLYTHWMESFGEQQSL